MNTNKDILFCSTPWEKLSAFYRVRLHFGMAWPIATAIQHAHVICSKDANIVVETTHGYDLRRRIYYEMNQPGLTQGIDYSFILDTVDLDKYITLICKLALTRVNKDSCTDRTRPLTWPKLDLDKEVQEMWDVWVRTFGLGSDSRIPFRSDVCHIRSEVLHGASRLLHQDKKKKKKEDLCHLATFGLIDFTYYHLAGNGIR
jgi:hypothetical protein